MVFEKDTYKKELLAFLALVDSRLQSKAVVVFFGGTALTLMDLKEASNDIDVIMISAENKAEFKRIFELARMELQLPEKEPMYLKFEPGIWIINDVLPNAQLYKQLSLKHLQVFTLNICDILFTKFNRYAPKDVADISKALSLIKLSRSKFKKRIFEIMKQQHHKERVNVEQKCAQFLNEFGSLMVP